MTEEAIKEKVLKYIQTNQGFVTFAELGRAFQRWGYSYRGDRAYTKENSKNICFWYGWSGAAFTIIAELIKARQVYFIPADVFAYVIDGETLNIPIAKKPYGYDAPHWFPVYLMARTNSHE